jgi:hypothetical protein
MDTELYQVHPLDNVHLGGKWENKTKKYHEEIQ